MPNLPMHIYLCQQVATELDWGYAHDHPGAAYLGSTTPDIRAMTKWDRARTHFSDLSVTHVGAGVQRMFELHPRLAGSENGLSPQTRSFLLGYVSHLVADEMWITTMFRPHFTPDNRVTDTEIESHIWDRAFSWTWIVRSWTKTTASPLKATPSPPSTRCRRWNSCRTN